MYKPDWSQPDPYQEMREAPMPDTESLLCEVGASYPVVTYPAAQQTPEQDEESAVDQTIFAGLVWP